MPQPGRYESIVEEDRTTNGFGFTCRCCGRHIDFTAAQITAAMPRIEAESRAAGRSRTSKELDAADLLRREAGWGLTPAEWPYDGNAHYYCPTCHTPDEYTA